MSDSRSEEQWGGSFFTTVYERAARPAGTPALSHTGIYICPPYMWDKGTQDPYRTIGAETYHKV